MAEEVVYYGQGTYHYDIETRVETYIPAPTEPDPELAHVDWDRVVCIRSADNQPISDEKDIQFYPERTGAAYDLMYPVDELEKTDAPAITPRNIIMDDDRENVTPRSAMVQLRVD